MNEVFSIEKPENPRPLVLDSPHSGRHYPGRDNITADDLTLKLAEDTYVDDLFSAAPSLGAAFLCARIHRAYIDLNRDTDDIDHKVLSRPWPEDELGPIDPTDRSASGIGLIRRILNPGQTLYRKMLEPEEIVERIETVYHPYHDALGELIEDAHSRFGAVWHINCHSMPARSAFSRMPMGNSVINRTQVDFCIGNIDGLSASREFTHVVKDFLEDQGYTVSLNDPFKGTVLTRKFAQPTRGRHSLQLEVNRGLYMNEVTGEKISNYNALKDDLANLIQHVGAYADDASHMITMAAD